MAIIQISRIQHRSGNLIDLPQLSDAEFGWASDSKRLFIGKEYPNENIEVLTSYSNISFSQIDGSGGDNVSIVAAENGQVLSHDGNNWVNKGGTAGGLITLGDIANIKIAGGAISYTIETDGTGNLSWSPKSTIVGHIANITQAPLGNAASPITITTETENFFTNSMQITITGAQSFFGLNGGSYYVDVLDSKTFKLYSDTGLTTPALNAAAYFPRTTCTQTTAVTNKITVSDSTTFYAVPGMPVKFSGTPLGGLVTDKTYYIHSGESLSPWNWIIVSETVGGPPVELSTSVVGSWTIFAGGGRVIATVGSGGGGGTSLAYGTNTSVQFNNNSLLEGSADFTFNNITKNLNVSNTVFATLLTGALTSNSQPNINQVGRLTSLVVGNITANTVFGNGTIVSAGNINAANLGTGGVVTAVGNVSGGNLSTTGNAAITGNVTAGNVNAKLFGALNGSVGATTANTGNFTTVTASSTIAATGNVSGGNLTTTGALAVTGNANVGNLGTGAIAATGNITIVGGRFVGDGSGLTNLVLGNVIASSANYASYAGNVTIAAQPNITSVGTLTSLTTTILTSGSNVTAGTITGNWSLTTGSRLNATYADLAEYYSADANYLPGTVVEFGGVNEVTLGTDGSARVAGVVSTDPAYVMNAACAGEHVVAVALQGRVPCKVRGHITKGDMLISGGDGFARPSITPAMGTVIGKALQDFTGEGSIEVAIGRL